MHVPHPGGTANRNCRPPLTPSRILHRAYSIVHRSNVTFPTLLQVCMYIPGLWWHARDVDALTLTRLTSGEAFMASCTRAKQATRSGGAQQLRGDHTTPTNRSLTKRSRSRWTSKDGLGNNSPVVSEAWLVVSWTKMPRAGL